MGYENSSPDEIFDGWGKDTDNSAPAPAEPKKESSYGGGGSSYGGGNSGGSSYGGAKKEYTKPKIPPNTEIILPYILNIDKDTPDGVLREIATVCREMDDRGFTVRWHSPGKGKMDQNHLIDNVKKKEIVLPWKDFDKDDGAMTGDYFVNVRGTALAKKLLFGYDNMSEFVQKINTHEIHMAMGKFCGERALCLLTWTPDGCQRHTDASKETGYRRSMIRICNIYGIPVFNFQRESAKDQLRDWLNTFDKPIE